MYFVLWWRFSQRMENKKKLNVRLLLEQAKTKDQNSIYKEDAEGCKKVFKKNAELLKTIIKESGWPFKEDQGDKASHNAWLIAQHSDHDINFQLQSLGMILSDIQNNKDALIDCAYLLDRILINFGGKQVFGTQFNGKTEYMDTVSPKQLDFLRKKIGLEAMEDYIKTMKNFIEKKNSQQDK